MGEKAVWDATNLKHFVEICKGEVNPGNRPLGYLSREGWKNLEENFEAKSGRKLTKTQLKNKWDSLKKEYTFFMELKNAATGLGWDDAKQTVDCDDTWWAEHLSRCNNPATGTKCNHVKFRKHGPPHLDLHVVFGTATCPGDVSSDSSNDDDVVEVDEMKLTSMKKQKGTKKRKASSSAIEAKDEKSPFYRMYKHTMGKINTGVDKLTYSIETPSNHVPSIAEVMKMVKECGVQEKTALFHTATLLIMKPEVRELFTLIETNEGRLDWLERAHEKEMRKA